jgi:hypothetical protein
MNPDGSLSAVPDPASYHGGSSPYPPRPGPLPYGDGGSGSGTGSNISNNSGAGGHMQSDGSYAYQPKFESGELFASGGLNSHMPPTPAASYNGISSSSSNSLPTLAQPDTAHQHGSSSGGGGNNLPMSRQASQGPISADSNGYAFAAHQPVGISPSIPNGSHGGAPGAYLPLGRQMTASPMHATMDVGAGYR